MYQKNDIFSALPGKSQPQSDICIKKNHLISDFDFVYIYDICNVVQMFMPVVVYKMY